MVTRGLMPGAIRIPNTVGDIGINVDLRAQQVIASVSIDAPKAGRGSTRVNWLVRQLKTASADIRVESWWLRARTSMSDLLGNVRNKPELLIPVDNQEITSFTVSLVRPMGLKRTAGKRSFIDSVLDTVDDFYADVVEHLREWQPPAPRLQRGSVPDEAHEEPKVEQAPSAQATRVSSSVATPASNLDAVEAEVGPAALGSTGSAQET